MFEIPEAKRVRRDELFDNTGSESEDDVRDEAAAAVARAKLQEQLSSLITFDAPAAPEQEGPADEAGPAAAEEVFEFKLFATSKGGAATASRVVLAAQEDPAAADEAGDAGGFVVARRPQSYYVAGPPTAEQQAQFEAVAVTGEQILAAAGQRCWGWEVPWRCEEGTWWGCEQKEETPGEEKEDSNSDKNEKEKENDREKQTKEEHLKAKKKRLNRERQLKRRQKEREKKQAMRTDGDGDASVQGAGEAAPLSADTMSE
uniref:Uncharacterized protein n=1 Tax=Pyricularia oryzae (strain P131) TaxID=1143193 RepID=L7J0F4_PYRO1